MKNSFWSCFELVKSLSLGKVTWLKWSYEHCGTWLDLSGHWLPSYQEGPEDISQCSWTEGIRPYLMSAGHQTGKLKLWTEASFCVCVCVFLRNENRIRHKFLKRRNSAVKGRSIRKESRTNRGARYVKLRLWQKCKGGLNIIYNTKLMKWVCLVQIVKIRWWTFNVVYLLGLL